ncbi:MAG: hypothetical protein WAQ25_00265 [Candidatus Saccharimonas sp.]
MSEIQTPQTDLLSNPNKLCFTGLFLPPEAREALLAQFPAAYTNVDADHITVGYYGDTPVEPDRATIPVGDVVEVPIIGQVIDKDLQVQTLIVGYPIPGKEHAHITISTGTNPDGSRVKPFLSNEAITNAVQKNTFMPVPEGTTLTMVTGYCLGDYDNGNGTIITTPVAA